MSLFSRIAGWFSRQPEAPRLVLDGRPLWWPKASLPINVWVDGVDASALSLVALAIHGFPGGALMFPVGLETETRNVFFGSRETFRNAIVIQPYTLTGTPGAFRCTSDLRYDKRTGEMRNALIEWNVQPGDTLGNVQRLRHELGHCLGLGHCNGTVMQASGGDWAKVNGFNDAQVSYLRGLRGER